MATRTAREILRIPTLTEKTAIRTITPQMATELLRLNTKNRQMNEKHMRVIASEMTAGTFVFNGDPIRFGGTTLVDGQHRLAACVLADKPFQAVVVLDLDHDTCFPSIDVGRRRSFSDLLHTEGETNSNALASVVAAHYSLIKYDFGNRNFNGSWALLGAWYKEHPGLLEATHWFSNHKTEFRAIGFGIGALGALWYEFGLKSPDDRDEFFSLLASGSNLSEGSPILLLRNRLIANSHSRTRLIVRDIVALIIKAWNVHRIGGSLHLLRWTRDGAKAEAFPTIE